MKKLIIIFFLTVITQYTCADEATNTLNKRIKDLVQQGLPYEEEDYDGDSFYEFLSQTLEHQLAPTKIRQNTTAFKILSSTKHPSSTLLKDNTTWLDLNFFAGKRLNDAFVGSKIDKTITNLGKAQLYTMLGATTDNQAEITRRQSIIKFFIKHPDLCNQIREVLRNFAQAESILLSFWQRDPLMHRINEHYDFKDPIFKHFNNNEYFLSTKYFFKTGKSITNLCTEVFGCTILGLYAISQLIPGMPNNEAETLREYAAEYKRSNILLSYLWHKDLRPINFGISAVGSYFLFSAILETVEWLTDLIMYDEVIHLKVQHLYAALECLDKLSTILPKELSLLDTEFTTLYNLATSSPSIQNADYNSLQDLLKYDGFAPNSYGLLANRGKLILSYKLFHKTKDCLLDNLRFLSLLDCYTSLATLMTTNPTTYCFAEFIDSGTSHLELENFTNPLIHAKKAIPNSLYLGTNAASLNCCITGPNAGGKSTLVKGIGINVLLAQSLGIAAAQYCRLKPYSFIATYLNITDDISAGNSLFKAEVLRTQELINAMISLPENQTGLLIFDEIFNGTSPAEGSAAAYAVAKRLGLLKNCTTVIATHFEYLTKLESMPEISYKNYKVTVRINEDASLSYPFKLEPGISNQHIAIDVLRSQGYESEILQEAERILHNR